MPLRVIGGKFRSRALLTPRGEGTRPTRAMVREAVFNLIQGKVDGSAALDLFAGSGAMGFEALSRGVARVTFCDKDADAFRVIRQNAENLEVAAQTRAIRADWKQAVRVLESEGAKFNIIFLDPPYLLDTLPMLEALAGLLDGNGVVVMEHDAKRLPALPPNLALVKSRVYGHTGVMLAGFPQEEP